MNMQAVEKMEANSNIVSSNMELKSWYENFLDGLKQLLTDISKSIKETIDNFKEQVQGLGAVAEQPEEPGTQFKS